MIEPSRATSDSALDNPLLGALYAAIDDVNALLPEDRKLEKSAELRIVGEGAQLDSLGLVNFIVAAERRIREATGETVSLTDLVQPDERATSHRTLGDLSRALQLAVGGPAE